jgi:hypothetical protein
MFSLKVVDTDMFLDMSPSAQNLYFHLGMRADDDGFVSSPKKIMSMVNAAENDFQILVGKGFIIPMATSGVCVVSHWKTNNLIKSDRYTETEYREEKARLVEIEGKYTFDHLLTERQRILLGSSSGTILEPQVRLGKDRLTLSEAEASPQRVEIVKESDDLPRKAPRKGKEAEAVMRLFSAKPQGWWVHKNQREAAERLFAEGMDKVRNGLKIMKEYEHDRYCPQAHTPWDYEARRPKLMAYMKRNGITV